MSYCDGSGIRVVLDSYDTIWLKGHNLAISLGFTLSAVTEILEKCDIIWLRQDNSSEISNVFKSEHDILYISENGLMTLILNSKDKLIAKNYLDWFYNSLLPESWEDFLNQIEMKCLILEEVYERKLQENKILEKALLGACKEVISMIMAAEKNFDQMRRRRYTTKINLYHQLVDAGFFVRNNWKMDIDQALAGNFHKTVAKLYEHNEKIICRMQNLYFEISSKLRC